MALKSLLKLLTYEVDTFPLRNTFPSGMLYCKAKLSRVWSRDKWNKSLNHWTVQCLLQLRWLDTHLQWEMLRLLGLVSVQTTKQDLKITGKWSYPQTTMCRCWPCLRYRHTWTRVCHQIPTLKGMEFLGVILFFPQSLTSLRMTCMNLSLGKTAWRAITGVTAWAWTGTVVTNKAGFSSSKFHYHTV